MPDTSETIEPAVLFNFEEYPPDTFFHERRTGVDRREGSPKREVEGRTERRARPERRRRVDPTTFEKQYTTDELEFMNAMQRYKNQSGKSFPNYREVLQVAFALGYRKDEPIE